MGDRRRRRNLPVLIIGLGRFGVSLGEELMAEGREVLAVERNRSLVQRYADRLP